MLGEVQQRFELVDAGTRLRECAEQVEAALVQVLAATPRRLP